MQIICISRGSYSKGQELAKSLAEKMGFQCLSREELLEEATGRGIAVGKMEMAMVKPHTFIDRFAQGKEHYKALATSLICEKALETNLVYHGRTGHLLLPGINNILRVRVVANLESRIESVMQRLGLDRSKARSYIDQVEEDRRRWVRSFYDVEWDEFSLYDVIINTDQLSVENASSALCAMAELPEFTLTPASRKKVQDLLLSSRCRLSLFDDERTYALDAVVRASDGVVSVTYSPRQEQLSKFIPDILKGVPGVREILCTRARTSIMWIQEKFEPGSEFLGDIIQIAKKWEAAVELVEISPASEGGETRPDAEIGDDIGHQGAAEPAAQSKEITGGIEDDIEKPLSLRDKGMKEMYDRLISAGHAGGSRVVKGSPMAFIRSLGHGIQYSLVVVGNVFVSKGHATQTRLTNEFVSFLNERLRVPVVVERELKQQYLFGIRQLMTLILYIAAVVAIYFLVLSNQIPALEISRLEGRWRWLSVGLVVLFIPVISYLWGTATKLLLKLIKFE